MEFPGSGELYFQADSVYIYHDDILTTEWVEENSIDLIVTSPPYNVDIKYGSYDDDISYEGYLEFTREWLARCLKLTKDDGRFCLNIPLDKNKGGQQSYAPTLPPWPNRLAGSITPLSSGMSRISPGERRGAPGSVPQPLT